MSTKRVIAGLLMALSLAGCGSQMGMRSPVELKSSAIAAMGASEKAYGLGADISHDPGVELDGGFELKALATRVDLRDQCSPVANQGAFGACTSFATVKGLQEFLMKKAGRFEPQSPAFIWANSRRQIGQKGQDSGVPTEFAMKMLDAYGSVPEEKFPYLASALHSDEAARHDFLTSQPDGALTKAGKKNRLMKGYKVVTKLSAVRNSLADGVPVLLAMKVYKSMNKVGADGMLPMPGKDDEFRGGHAVIAVGYDSQKRVLIVRNSWGPKWADGGYFYMPYEYVKQGHVRIAIVPKI